LVADESREPISAPAQRRGGLASRKVRGERRPLVDLRKPLAAGDVLAESEQLDLVVVVADAALLVDHDGAVPDLAGSDADHAGDARHRHAAADVERARFVPADG